MKVSFLNTLSCSLLLTSVAGGFGCNGKFGDLPLPQGGVASGPHGMSGQGGSTGSGSLADDPGRVVMHRLNAVEYNNTVRDLLGVGTRLPDAFPPDDTAYGFDNIAEALNLTDVHLEQYLATSAAIASAALAAPARQKLITCDLATQKETCVKSVLRTFLPRAWRRPTSDEEVTGLTDLFTARKADGDADDEAFARVLQAVLIAPQFLFRLEPNAQGSKGAPRPLDDFEVASRLSYFLWSSMPDDELFRAAGAHELGDTTQLTAQVHRMLADSKAHAMGENFGAQWLSTRNLSSVQPDKTAFPTFDEDLRAAMAQETTLLFGDIASGTTPISDLLTSGFSYLNDRLAKHYGLPLVGSATSVRTKVPSQRGGLLTNASILTVNAHPKETAPVLRGKWILSQLLCTDIPPPPPDVPTEPPAMANQSRRQRLAAHRQSSTCASCHGLMDPLGLALEQYDGVGAFRTTDNGVAIDTSGQLPGGMAFAGLEGLGAVLAADPAFLRCATQHVFMYAIGRGTREGGADDPIVDGATQSLSTNGQKLPLLVEKLVLSDAFRRRQDDTLTVSDVEGGAP